MALITCPECENLVSDQAATCPKCGFPLSVIKNDNSTSVESTIDSATQKQEHHSTLNKKSIAIACIAIACVILIAVVGFFFKKASDEKAAAEAQAAAEQAAKEARAEYIQNLKSFLWESLSGAADAESVCNLTYRVWHDTIYEEYDSETVAYTKSNGVYHDDFNTSLVKLYSSDKIINAVSTIKENQDTVDQLYIALQNPTEEFLSCYDVVGELYSAYYNLTNLAVSPSGSLKTYSEDFGDYDSEFLKQYDKLELLIPEK